MTEQSLPGSPTDHPGDAIRLAPVELLVLQGTPFCNIDCSYCYLPARTDRSVMTVDTVRLACRQLVRARLLSGSLDVLWHAGEPLILPVEFYERAFSAIEEEVQGTPVRHKIQTNATLIDRDWTALFRRWNVDVGVSLDGPAHIHDRHRVARSGRPTSGRVLAGIEQLRRAGLDLSVICVLTQTFIDRPEELFAFFESLGVDHIGFNIDEAAGPHSRSSHSAAGSEPAFRHFLKTYFALVAGSGSRQRVRELTRGLMNVFKTRLEASYETVPIRVLTVGQDGGFATFSPDLFGLRHPKLGPMMLGNVHDERPFEDLGRDARLLEMVRSIRRGLDACERACAYFDVCKGGLPSNKLGQHGTFEATETVACTFKQKAVTNAVVELLLDGRLQGYPGAAHEAAKHILPALGLNENDARSDA